MPDKAAREIAGDAELQRIGHRIRELREQAGLTQAQLAGAIGLHRVTLNRLENGHVDVGISRVVPLSEALGVAPGSLFA